MKLSNHFPKLILTIIVILSILISFFVIQAHDIISNHTRQATETAIAPSTNLMGGTWYKSSGVYGTASGIETLWHTTSGYLGGGIHPWEKSFYDCQSLDYVKGGFTTDGRTINFGSAKSTLSYDMNSVSYITGNSLSGTVSNTRTKGSGSHTSNATIIAPYGRTSGTHIVYGDFSSINGDYTSITSSDPSVSWESLKKTSGDQNVYMQIQLSSAGYYTSWLMFYKFQIPQNIQFGTVTKIKAIWGSSRSTEIDLAVSILKAGDKEYTRYPQTSPPYATWIPLHPNVGYHFLEITDSDDISEIINYGFLDLLISAGGADLSPGGTVRFYYFYLELTVNGKQKTDLIYDYSFNALNDDVYSPNDISIPYIKSFTLNVNLKIESNTALNPTFANVSLIEGKFPYNKLKIHTGNLVLGWNNLTFTVDYVDTPSRFFSADGVLKIRIQMGYSLSYYPSAYKKLYCKADYIRVNVSSLALTFAPLSTDTWQAVKIRAKGTFTMYAEGVNLGTKTSSVYQVWTITLPPGLTLSFLSLTTPSSASIDWITFVKSSTTKNPIRDIDVGSATADLYSGTYYTDNTAPHDLSVSSNKIVQKAYFCAEHDYEYGEIYKSVSLTSKGIYQNKAIKIIYSTETTGIDPAAPKIGLRSSTTGNFHYVNLYLTSGNNVSKTIPLISFKKNDDFNQLKILLTDTGSSAGSTSVTTLKITIYALEIVDYPIPQITITSPANNATISGWFKIKGTASYPTNMVALRIHLGSDLVFETTGLWYIYLFEIDINSLVYQEGYYTIKVNATGQNGIWNCETIKIKIDNYIDPIVTIQGYSRQVLYDTLLINSTVKIDSTLTVSSLKYYLNDTPIATIPSYPWSKLLYVDDFPEGDYILKVEVIDSKGQIAQDKISLLIDKTPPPIIALEWTGKKLVLWDVPYYTIQPNLTALTCNVTRVEFYINGELVDTDWDGRDYIMYTYYFWQVANGTTYQVKIVAYDCSGQSNWLNFTMVYYTAQPTIADIIEIIINFFIWLIEWISSGFGLFYIAGVVIGSTFLSVSQWNRKALGSFIGIGTMISGLVTTLVLNPAFGFLMSLVSLGMGSGGALAGLGLRRTILSDNNKNKKCLANPKSISCRILFNANDLKQIKLRNPKHKPEPKLKRNQIF